MINPSGTLRNPMLSDWVLYQYRKQRLNKLSPTHLLDEVGDYHGTQYEKSVYESTGTGKITSSHITTQTVISKKGTAVLTISTGQIAIGAGWVSNILLTDGTFYKCEERSGAAAFDSSGIKNGILVNITHGTVKETDLVNYTNKEGYNINGSVIIPKADSKLVKVEDYPWTWIFGNGGVGFYSTYKDNVFKPSDDFTIEVGSEANYAAVTGIDLSNQSLTTDFTSGLLSKFKYLYSLLLNQNAISNVNVTQNEFLGRLFIGNSNITSIDIGNNVNLTNLGIGGANLTSINLSNNPLLAEVRLWGNQLSSIDLSNNPQIEILELFANTGITNIDLSNNPLLTYVRTQSTKCNENVNSKMLTDLDSHGLPDGYFHSSIFGGAALTAAGLIAKSNLQAKGWNIVGL